MTMKFPGIVFTCLMLLAAAKCQSQNADFTTDANVVYGSVSGTSLLMDVYKPAKPNGLGIVFIPGSAFGFVYPATYNQQQLKEDFTLDSIYTGRLSRILLQKGYTVFIINHRFCPAFIYKDIIADCRRAVRFIRFNAARYGIDPAHIGAMGHSSGANLSAILGTMDESFDKPGNAMDSLSSKVQAVVTLAAPFDLSDYDRPGDTAFLDVNFAMAVMKAYVGEMPSKKDGLYQMTGKYAEASPMAHVSSGDAPMLIYYSDNDPVIPARQAIAMEKVMQQNKVPVKTVKRVNQEHTPLPDMEEIDRWFKEWLK